jgi:hypothetical protein
MLFPSVLLISQAFLQPFKLSLFMRCQTLCGSFIEKNWTETVSVKFFIFYSSVNPFIVFINIFESFEDYLVNKRAACGIAARQYQCAEPLFVKVAVSYKNRP